MNVRCPENMNMSAPEVKLELAMLSLFDPLRLKAPPCIGSSWRTSKSGGRVGEAPGGGPRARLAQDLSLRVPL